MKHLKCKHQTPGARCDLPENIVYDSSLDADVAYCLAYKLSADYNKCLHFIPKTDKQ